jgi:indole-3-glycerol phosphate synthase
MVQIRRRQPNPAVEVLGLRYQVAIPGAEPQNILEEIVWYKEKEITDLRERLPLEKLKQKVNTIPATRNFFQALKQSKTQPAVIAEVKKASPSKGVIREDFDPVAIKNSFKAVLITCLKFGMLLIYPYFVKILLFIPIKFIWLDIMELMRFY